MDQIIIKIGLIAAFLSFAFVLLRSNSSARSQALRTVGLGLFVAAAIVAVLFPTLVNDVAVMIGVGRGADLLLYAFIIVFMAQSLTTHRSKRAQDERITGLARAIALSNPQYPRRDDN